MKNLEQMTHWVMSWS
jgi:hypothetical protein